MTDREDKQARHDLVCRCGEPYDSCLFPRQCGATKQKGNITLCCIASEGHAPSAHVFEELTTMREEYDFSYARRRRGPVESVCTNCGEPIYLGLGQPGKWFHDNGFGFCSGVTGKTAEPRMT